MLFEGLNHTTVARGTLFLYTAPFFVAPIAHWVLPNDKLNTQKVIGLLVAFVGLSLAFSDRLFNDGSTLAVANTLKGDLLCLGAAFFWGISTIIVKATRLQGEAPEKNLLYQLMTSAFLLLLVAWPLGEKGIFAPTAKVWAGFAYQTIIVASTGYLLWFRLIARYSASTMHAFTFLSPIFGVIAGTLLLSEPLGLHIVAALVLVALGLLLVNKA